MAVGLMALYAMGHKSYVVHAPLRDALSYFGNNEAYQGAHASIKQIFQGDSPTKEIAAFFFKGSSSSQGLRETSAIVMGESVQRLLDRFRFQPDSQQLIVSTIAKTEAPVLCFAPPHLAALSPPAPPQLNI